MREFIYILAGYLSGSILFACFAGYLFHGTDITADSPDRNPGAANAFQYGGLACGLLTLGGDLFKGFFPIYCYLHPRLEAGLPPAALPLSFALVLSAPVIGHMLPVFHHFRGGKGIAVSFGCLLGLFPILQPVLLLAAVFLFYSLIVRIHPHFYRTILTYLTTEGGFLLLIRVPAVRMGFLLIAIAILLRLHASKEPRERCQVTLLWKH